MIKDELFSINILPSEIDLVKKDCSQQFYCVCEVFQDNGCGYNRYDIQKEVIKYYTERAESIRNMSNEDFMESYGFYYDKERK